MRIVVTGAAGMLGRELAEVLSGPPNRHELHLARRPDCDVTQSDNVKRCFAAARPDVVIHAAAYTDVDGCERNPVLAMQVNGDGTRNVSRAAAAVGARLIYIGTDYVFDGARRQPYTEEDEPHPLSAYGRSKLAGESAVREEHADHLIVRTAWLYGRYGRHFVGAVLERARRGEPLRVVDDQVGCPTWAKHLACSMAELLSTGASGIVHAAGSGSCSWYEFATVILAEAKARGQIADCSIARISSCELGRVAPRPAYSVLSNRRLQELGLAPLPEWREAIREFLAAAG